MPRRGFPGGAARGTFAPGGGRWGGSRGTPRRRLRGTSPRPRARSGLRGLTHRAVDAEAGLPEGSCSAYMRTRVALLRRLTEYVTSQFARDIAELTRRIEQHAPVDGYVVRETLAMLRSWLDDPD